MIKFDKQTIISFSKEINNSPFENAYAKTNYILKIIMQDIMAVNSYINNYELYIANEALTRGEIPATTLDLFLVLEAKQLELNFIDDKLYRLKTTTMNFGKNFFKNFKLFNRKKKNKKNKAKKDEKLEEIEKYEIDEKRLNSYNIKHFNVDLLHELAKYFTDKTTLFITDKCIKIAGKDDIGVFIKLYTVFKNDDDTYSLYNLKTKQKIIVNFKERFNNIEIANIKTNGMFETQLAIFNNIYYNLFKNVPNQILIESLLYSCPSNLFNEDVYCTTLSLVNYLKNTNIKNLISICDDNELLKDTMISNNSVERLYKFINILNIV